MKNFSKILTAFIVASAMLATGAAYAGEGKHKKHGKKAEEKAPEKAAEAPAAAAPAEKAPAAPAAKK